jgi:hypothetical protein
MDAKAAILSSMRTWTIRNRFGKARTRHQGDDAPVQEIDVFDFLAGQMQELALADADDLQIRLEGLIFKALNISATERVRGFCGIPKDALRVQLADGELMNPAAKRTIDRDLL